MSRVDRLVARRREDTRKARVRYENAGPGRRRAMKDIDGKPLLTSGRHKQGDEWWRVHLADLVERRVVQPGKAGHSKTTYMPKAVILVKSKHAPTMTTPPRVAPRGTLTRQVQRALYRRACKASGVPWKAT